MAAHADVPPHLWQGFDFGFGLAVRERLNQGPFDVDQDHVRPWQAKMDISDTDPSCNENVLEVPFVEGKLR